MKRDVAVVILLVTAAALSFLADGAVAGLIGRLQHPAAVYVMSWFSHIVTFVVVLLGMTTLFLIEEKKARWIKALWLGVAAAVAASGVLKLLVERARPAAEPVAVSFFSNSFPSMHTAIAFALLPMLDREFPVLKWFWAAFAVLIAVSRVYLGVHYFSDVAWGALLGLGIGRGAVWLQEKGKLG